MGNSKTVQLWHDRVLYDMDTAKAMLQTRRFFYAVFMCQQAVEKCFKALLAHQNREIIPIQNLRRLAELADVIRDLDESTLRRMDFLSID
ncbi:MAG: HEPN domain-containing protein [Armatimonadota bacterium]